MHIAINGIMTLNYGKKIQGLTSVVGEKGEPMITPIRYKIIYALKKLIAKVCGKEYGCCEKLLANCRRCLERRADEHTD